MAVPPPRISQWVQDVGPKRPPGGVFPHRSVRPKPYARGPPGYVLVAASLGITAFGLWRWANNAEELDYRNLAKINERFERAYVLQAIEEADWQRRHKAMVDQERSWMRNRPDWVVNKSHYFTLRPDRANNDPVDTRTMTNLNPL